MSERNDLLKELVYGIDEQALYERDEDERRDFVQSYITGNEPEQVEFKRKLTELLSQDNEIAERINWRKRNGTLPEDFRFGELNENLLMTLMNDGFIGAELNEHINDAYEHTQEWKSQQPKDKFDWDTVWYMRSF